MSWMKVRCHNCGSTDVKLAALGFNTCTNCGTHHQMRLDNWGHVKKRVVDRIPIGYNKGPFAIQKADTRETNDFG